MRLLKKKIVVAGCLPLVNPERLKRETRSDATIGPAPGEAIVSLIENLSRRMKSDSLVNSTTRMPSLALPTKRLNRLVDIIPISYGCKGTCSYCCVRIARGKLRSHTISEIVDRARKSLPGDTRELWITAQDTASYGSDIGSNLPQLLEAICALKGHFKIRVGMMNPDTCQEILDSLVMTYENEHVFKYIHIPLQSGDDKILDKMNRRYLAEDFRSVVAVFRRFFPRITVSTDIICGFPGETEASFDKTLKIIREVAPDIVNVSKFCPRPKTNAAKMHTGFLQSGEIKSRSSRLAKFVKQLSLERNRSWIGWNGEVLIDEQGKVNNSWVGRNFAYKPVVVHSHENLYARTLNVEITAAFPTYLLGRIKGPQPL